VLDSALVLREAPVVWDSIPDMTAIAI